MIKPAKYWYGYPSAAAVICDECGATIHEDTNPDRAIEGVPEESVIVRETKFDKHGAHSISLDFCSPQCHNAYFGIAENEDEESKEETKEKEKEKQTQ